MLQVNQEDHSSDIMKCVLVGDSGVGKTKLISAKVNGQKLSSENFENPVLHKPTVWAMDQYRPYQEVIDCVPVSFILWDTFGDHGVNRCYAYKGSNVVMICFSVVKRQSLENVKEIWIREAKMYCPNASLILVACKVDLRSSFNDISKSPRLNTNRKNALRPEDIVSTRDGREMAAEIGAYYYETSVLTGYGVQDVFRNAVRIAFSRRKRFSFRSHLHLKPPIPQPIVLPPMPALPSDLLDLPTRADLTFSKIFNVTDKLSASDITIKVDDEKISCHRLILAAGSGLFYKLLVCKECKEYEHLKRWDHLHARTQTGIMDLINSADFTKDSQLTVEINSSDHLEISLKIDRVKKESVVCSLYFLYTGKIPPYFNPSDFGELELVAKILQVPYLTESTLFVCYNLVERSKRLIDLGLTFHVFNDIEILLDDGVRMFAHKFMLTSRCEFMKIMFGYEFRESITSQVELPGVSNELCSAFLEFTYTDSLKTSGSKLSVLDCVRGLEFADRMCMSSFQRYLEVRLLEHLTNAKRINFDDLIIVHNVCRMFNLSNSCNWCLRYLANNFIFLSEDSLNKLSQSDRNYVTIHRWPPQWFFDECYDYDAHLENEENIKRAKDKNMITSLVSSLFS